MTKLFQRKKHHAEFSAIILQTHLKLPNIHEDVSNIRSNHDPVLAAINTFQNDPVVVNIKQREFNTILSLLIT